ncbi:MAG: adenylate/guanylate cyclase domain-containing protein [Pseudomonadota bacterium]
MQTIRQWLDRVGLPQYAEAFETNDVDPDVLPALTEEDLHRLGVSLGHRKRILLALREASALIPDRSPLESTAASTQSSIESLTVQGERRQVTVLFCDLVGSTALSSTHDPEEYRSILSRYHESCIGAIQRFEGFVAQIQGDGIVAYFGYPLAHESEADRAVRAALYIVETLANLDVGSAGPLRVRIGIASGLVVVSHILAPDKSAVGETPNLAARLQTVAQPGEVVVSERTRSLAGGGFEYEYRGVHALKGIAEPTRAWKVVGPSDAVSRFEAATRGGLTLMVGREQEIGLLQDRWELSRAGEGQVVLLQGEPGIGKSRMLRAFRERLSARIEMALQYQCSPYYVNSAFYPIADHLERALKFQRDDSPEQKLDKIERRLGDELKHGRNDCSLLARALSIPCDERYGSQALSPQRQKEDTMRLLVDLVAEVAAQRATVVLFEDVHWADPTTLEVLGALVDRAEKLPLLVLITYRPEFTPPWTSRAHVTLQALTRLSRAQGASIVLRIAGKSLPSELVSKIVDKTDGVPLFLEELTKAVTESNMVVDLGDRYDYSGKVEKLEIPNTLRDSLMARLDRLIPVKEIAQIGACLGREFSYELVHAVSPMNEPQLNEALDKLTASDLVYRRNTPLGTVYIFKHALVQDAAYDSLLKSKRQTLHAQIAEAISQRFPSKLETEPELLAHHYTEAGMTRDAILYWEKAGDLAQQRFALQESVSSYRQAISLLTAVDKTEENMKRHIDIAVKWADLIVPSADIISALETAERYAEKLADMNRLANVASYLGQLLFYLGRFEPARARLERVIGMTDSLPGKDRVGSSFRCLGQLYLMGYSRCSEGLKYIEQAMPIVQATGNRFEESCCHGLMGLEYGFLGRFEESFAAFDSAICAARAGQQRSIECWNLSWRCHVHSLKGDWEKAAVGAEDGIALSQKIENIWALNWCALQLSYAQFMTSRDLSLIERVKEALGKLAGTVCISIAGCYLTDMLYLSGAFREANTYADRALTDLDHGSYFSADVRAHQLKSMAAAGEPYPDWSFVTRTMEKAISIARSQQRIPDLAICQYRQAQLLQQKGAYADARSRLDEAEKLFAAMNMTWWLGEARKLRREI